MAVIRVETETGEINPPEEHFYIMNLGVIPAMRDQNALSRTERDVLLELCEHLEYRTNMIAVRGRPMTVAELAQIMHMDAANTSRYMKNLVRKNVVGRWEHGQVQAYFLNPTIARKGDVPETFYDLFDEKAHEKTVPGSKRVLVRHRSTSLLVMP